MSRIEVAAESVDGINPLDDQVRSEIRYGAGPRSHHVLGRLAGEPGVVAYAHAARDEGGASGHLVVHPDHRGRGIGRQVLDHLLGLIQTADPGRTGPEPEPSPSTLSPATLSPSTLSPSALPRATLRLWAHGNTPGAAALAAARGLRSGRELLQMRRSLAQPLPDPTYPDGISVRTFDPGQDDEPWVSLNAASFAAHPEQGRLSIDDLRHRMAETWFDQAGFFVAERRGELEGSHWTKVHPPGGSGADSAPVGEVYAVGVHPRAQGLGLGKALTLTGLHHLQERGLAEVMLYVDGDNTAAVSLYRRLGFSTTRTDVMYTTH